MVMGKKFRLCMLVMGLIVQCAAVAAEKSVEPACPLPRGAAGQSFFQRCEAKGLASGKDLNLLYCLKKFNENRDVIGLKLYRWEVEGCAGRSISKRCGVQTCQRLQSYEPKFR
jgi:hypothetical protein